MERRPCPWHEQRASAAPDHSTAGNHPNSALLGEHLGLAVQGHLAGVDLRGRRSIKQRAEDSSGALSCLGGIERDGCAVLPHGLSAGQARRLAAWRLTGRRMLKQNAVAT